MSGTTANSGLGRRRMMTVLLGLTVIYAIAIRAYNLNEPWGRHLLGINGAWHSIIARNLLRYGFLATRGAPVLNTGLAEPAEWTFYLHHPPLLDWLLALSFRVFGVHEWSARLPALVFSLGCIGLVYRMARRVHGVGVAAGAVFFMAAMPMTAIYGMHVDYPGPMSLFFCLLSLSAGQQFLETRRERAWRTLVVAVTLSCLTDWNGFYLAPLLVAYQYTQPRAQRTRRLWWLLGYSIFLLAVLLAYYGMLAGGLQFLINKFLSRTYSFQSDRGQQFTLFGGLRQIGSYLWRLYTPAVLLATVAWIGGWWARRIRRSPARREDLVWLLLAFGLINVLVPFQDAYVHDAMSLFFAPGFAWCAALVGHDLLAGTDRRPWPAWLRPALAGVAMAVLTAWFGYVSYVDPQHRRHRADAAYGYTAEQLGEVIRRHSPPDEAVMLAAEEGCMPAVWFYADRPLVPFASTVGLFQRCLAQPQIFAAECFPTPARTPAAWYVIPVLFTTRYQRLLNYLVDHYPYTMDGPFLVFDLRPGTTGPR